MELTFGYRPFIPLNGELMNAIDTDDGLQFPSGSDIVLDVDIVGGQEVCLTLLDSIGNSAMLQCIGHD